MATYSQDSQRLVIVAKKAVATATAPVAGDVKVIAASGGTAVAGNPIKVLFATGKPPAGVIGGTADLNLVSETIKPEMIVSAAFRGFAAPTFQATEIAVGTPIPNNEYYITIDMGSYGSTSVQNTAQIYGVHVSKAADTAADIAAGLAANINKNVSRSGMNRVSASTAGAVVTITAVQQHIIDFNNPWNPIRFQASLNDTFASDATITNVAETSKGFGFGPEVANIEHFAQGSEANWTWLDYPLMYPRDLYTDPTQEYDCISLRLRTVNEGFGSNISSFRQVEVFGEAGTLFALATDLNTILGTTLPTS